MNRLSFQQQLLDLLTQGKLEQAISSMLEDKEQVVDSTNKEEIRLLAGQLARAKQKLLLKQEDEEGLTILENRITERLIDLIQQLPKQPVQQESPKFEQQKSLYAQLTYKKLGCTLSLTLTVLLLIFFQPFKWISKPSESIIVQAMDEPRYIQLPDASTIVLNQNSELRYASLTNAKEWIFQLEGEAFFDLQKRPQRKIRIETVDVDIEVIGTKLNVRAYTEEEETEVFVQSGRIDCILKRTSERYELKDKQKVLLHRRKQTAVEDYKRSWDRKDNTVAWLTRKLHFDNTSIRAVIPMIERSYPVKIEVGNEAILNCKFTAQFDHEELEGVLTTLAIANDLSVSKAPIEHHLTSQPILKVRLDGFGCLPRERDH